MASGHYDRNSPLSSSEQPVSGSTSPHVIKPVRLPHKQRSSSMNSVTSNHTRSMSIISLESPRNSIVSIDDGFIRPTRNNSSTSLNSLGTATNHPPTSVLRTPDEEISHSNLFPIVIDHESDKPDNYVTRPKVKTVLRNSSAIMSDDDSESEKPKSPHQKKILHSPQSRLLHHFKRDFQFKIKAPSIARLTEKSFPNDKPMQMESKLGPSDKSLMLHDSKPPNDATPSPLSLNLGSINPLSRISPPLRKPDIYWKPDDDASVSSSSSSSSPSVIPSPLPLVKDKLKIMKQNKKSSNITSKSPNLIQQSIYLKKKMIFSKELQLELLSSNPNNYISNNIVLNPSPIDKSLDTKFIDPKRSSMSPLLPTSLPAVDAAKFTKEYDNQPIITTLKQQNKLIYQLNRKWNKSILEATNVISSSYSKLKDDNKGKGQLLLDKAASEAISRHRKRSRRDLFDSDDDDDVLGSGLKDDSS